MKKDHVETIGIIGLGLIGGGLARTIKRVYPDIRIIAYNRTNEVLNEALYEGIIDEPSWDITEVFSECDYIFLCVPVLSVREYLELLKPHLSEGTILSDVGSTKSEIHAMVKELELERFFIGGHPMTGSEKTGYAHSTDRMFENAWYILTPSEEMELQEVSAFSAFISSLGALPLILTAAEHDHITAAVSHVPHVISACLVNMVRELDDEHTYMKMIAAGGFKDITRISSSSPQMWQEICMANTEEICSILDKYVRMLTEFRFAIRNEDSDKLLEYFTECKEYRDSFQEQTSGPIRREYRIYTDLNDEAGAIAEIAAILAAAHISIKNIGIVHNRSYERGVLRIEFYEEDPSRQAAELLRTKGYTVYE